MPIKSMETIKAGKIYTLLKDMKVRTGPGTDYPQKQYNELPSGVKQFAYDQLFAVLKTETKVAAIKVIINNKKEVWLKISAGYILAKTQKEIYIK